MQNVLESLMNQGDQTENTQGVYLDTFIDNLFDFALDKPVLYIDKKLNTKRIDEVKLDLSAILYMTAFGTLAANQLSLPVI